MRRDVIDNLLDRLSEISVRLSDISVRFGRRSQAVSRDVIADLRVRSHDLRKVVDDLRIRSKDLRWSLPASRLRRSPDAIIVIPLLGAALILGVLAATAATHGSSDGQDSDLVPAAARAVGITGDVNSGNVVTQTVTRKGKTVRIIRYRKKPGRVVLETTSGRAVTLPGNSITLPAVTVARTRTQTVTDVVTKTEISTVTETLPPVTVTVVETVTEAKPDKP
jgi:hypothetical protein